MRMSNEPNSSQAVELIRFAGQNSDKTGQVKWNLKAVGEIICHDQQACVNSIKPNGATFQKAFPFIFKDTLLLRTGSHPGYVTPEGESLISLQVWLLRGTRLSSPTGIYYNPDETIV